MKVIFTLNERFCFTKTVQLGKYPRQLFDSDKKKNVQKLLGLFITQSFKKDYSAWILNPLFPFLLYPPLVIP